MKKKQRPYIRSMKMLHEDGGKPKVRIIAVGDAGVRQITKSLTREDDAQWVADSFITTLK